MGLRPGRPRTERRRVRLRSASPGRMRLWLGVVHGDTEGAQRMQQAVSNLHGVVQAKVNPLTGSLLLRWEEERPISDLTEQLAAALPPDVAPQVREAINQVTQALRMEARGPRRRGGTGSVIRWRGGAAPRAQAPTTAAPPWHTWHVDRVLEWLNVSFPKGLTDSLVAERRVRHGANLLPQPEGRSDAAIFFSQLGSAPVLLLLGATALAAITGAPGDAVVILGVVALNATIGFFTERASERVIRGLLKEERRMARVRRDGRAVDVPVDGLVPGDVILLGAGDQVPADARVVHEEGLSVSESSLTGESQPVDKHASAVPERDAPLADRRSMLYRGTQVTGGKGEAVVVATGEGTELGRIQRELAAVEAMQTPMQRELAHMGRQLVSLSGAVCVGVFVVGVARGHGLLSMLRVAVSLAVAAVPEGLPTVATTALALGVRRMRQHRVVIRNVGAIETLGAVELVCFDKTGTITENRMVAQAAHLDAGIVDLLEEPLDPLRSLRLPMAAVLCSDVTAEADGDDEAAELRGEPTEVALVELGLAVGVDLRATRRTHPRIGGRPRGGERRVMSTLHDAPGGPMLFMKGQPEQVLDRCVHRETREGLRPLDDEDRDAILTANEQMAGRGLRVLAFAWGGGEAADLDREQGLVWSGLVGIADPPRAGIDGVLQRFRDAGIQCVMVTGDQGGTALAVSRAVGMAPHGRLEVLDAVKLDRMQPEVLRSLASRVDVFARVSPSQKLQIVRALQEAGHVVAMTGDGVNDGPALKAADIGVALGRSGAEVAQQVSDMVLLDDDLTSMLVATEEGRGIYEDIRHAVSFILATNLSEILVTAVCVGAGVPAPLSSMQLLWINLITDVFPELALAVQPPSEDIMERPPRRSGQPMFQNQDLARFGFEGSLMTGAALSAYAYALAKYGSGAKASTTAFMGLTVAQLLHTVSARSETHSIFDRETLRQNAYLPGAIAGSIGLQLASDMWPTARRMLGLVPLGGWDWLVSVMAGAMPFLVIEANKRIGRLLPPGAIRETGRVERTARTGGEAS